MLTMIRRPRRGWSAVLALGALTATGALAQAQAQETRPRVRVESDCRCVDRDGNEIANCTCFRTPDVSGMVARFVPWGGDRPRMGITITEDRDDTDASRGVRVESVLEDGPADEAGLQEGDVITAVDGKNLLRPLDNEAEEDFDLEGSVAVQRLMAILRDTEEGQEVRVDYLRDGEARTATVEVRELNEAMEDMRERLGEFRFQGGEPRVLSFYGQRDRPRGSVEIRTAPEFYFRSFGDRVGGVAMEELNPKLGEYFGTDHGVLVTDVGEDSTLGLEPGDVILEIGGREATDPGRVRRILGSYEDDEAITLRIIRQKREMSVQGRLSR